MYIMIDSGTTNTRISLFDDNTEKIKDRIKLKVGARDNVISDGCSVYKSEIKKGIEKIITDNGLKAKDIKKLCASGMICSEIGLMNIPHITAPADAKKLSENTKTVVINDISDIPFCFIPGVKNNTEAVNIDNISDVDMMRGEETEILGIMELEKITPPFTAVLPGSHNKIINIDKSLKISSCNTTISGEMLSVISSYTVIKKTLINGLADSYDVDYLIKGYEQSKKYGFNNTAFKVRCAGLFTDMTEVELSSFFCGALLQDDIGLIINTGENNRYVIGGGNPLKNMLAELLQHEDKAAQIIKISAQTAENATVFGAYSIIKNQK